MCSSHRSPRRQWTGLDGDTMLSTPPSVSPVFPTHAVQLPNKQTSDCRHHALDLVPDEGPKENDTRVHRPALGEGFITNRLFRYHRAGFEAEYQHHHQLFHKRVVHALTLRSFLFWGGPLIPVRRCVCFPFVAFWVLRDRLDRA